MWLFIMRLLFKAHHLPFKSQHLIGLIFVGCCISLVMIYCQIKYHVNTTELKTALNQPLNLTSLDSLKQQTSALQNKLTEPSFNELSSFEIQQTSYIDFITSVSSKWPIQYKQITALNADKKQIKFNMMLPTDELPLYIENFKQKIPDASLFKIKITPYDLHSHYIHLELERKDATSI